MASGPHCVSRNDSWMSEYMRAYSGASIHNILSTDQQPPDSRKESNKSDRSTVSREVVRVDILNMFDYDLVN